MPLILWTIRIAAALYVIAVDGCLRGRPKFARAAWTLGCLFFLAHVWAAFQFHHNWSHSAAYLETARQTAELFGVRSGSGLYLNYLFTLVWILDVAWWWLRPEGYLRRSRWIATSIHGFFAFLFFNGAVVFASGPTRWAGAAATLYLGAMLWNRRPPLVPVGGPLKSHPHRDEPALGKRRP